MNDGTMKGRAVDSAILVVGTAEIVVVGTAEVVAVGTAATAVVLSERRFEGIATAVAATVAVLIAVAISQSVVSRQLG